jgi:multidrug resistance protein, MATE family
MFSQSAFLADFAELALPVTTTVFLGHLGSDVLAASAVSSMWCNALGFAPLMGMSMGLESLAPHAFGSANPMLVGLYTQRAMLICLLTCIPIAVVWALSGFGFKLMSVPDNILGPAVQLTLWRIPGLPATAFFECLRRFVVAQNLVWPTTATCFVVVLWHVPSTWLFVKWFGYLGSSYSVTLSQWLMVFILLLILLIRERFVQPERRLRNSWPTLKLRDVLELAGLKQYLSFALPACGSLVIEWGGYEVYAALAARLGQTALATHSIMNATTSIWYMVPWGMSTAASTLMGQYLGEGEGLRARNMALLCYVLLFGWGLINGGLGMIYRYAWGALFSNDQAVISMTASLFPILWCYEIVDCLKCGGVSLLRGTGRPGPTFYGNILALAMGFVLAMVLGLYVGMGMQGIWWGLTASWLVAAIIYTIIMVRTDWEDEVRKTALELARTSHVLLPANADQVNAHDEELVALAGEEEELVE